MYKRQDLLTGLPNRNAFEKRMEVLRGSGISGTMVVVADLNDLKQMCIRDRHITEEIRELSSMIISREGVLLHPFCGHDETFDLSLIHI